MLKPYVQRQFEFTNSVPTVQFVNSCAHDDTDTYTNTAVTESDKSSINLSAQERAQLNKVLTDFSDIF